MSARAATTSVRRVLFAWLVGSISGGGLTAIAMMILTLVGYILGGGVGAPEAWGAWLGWVFLVGGFALVVASAAYAIGLALLGGPIWLWFHRAGWRGPGTAAALGAGLNVIGVGALSVGQGMMSGFAGGGFTGGGDLTPSKVAVFVLIQLAILSPFELIGAVVGWIVWRTAYRRESVR